MSMEIARRLIPFTVHDPYCHGKYEGQINAYCTCGLSRVLAEIQETDRRSVYQPSHDRRQYYGHTVGPWRETAS